MSILGPVSQAAVVKGVIPVLRQFEYQNIPCSRAQTGLGDYVSQKSRTYAKKGRFKCESEGALLEA